MTISYNLDVSSSNSFTFLRVLFRWRGSLWKSVLNEVIIWIIMFYCVFAFYRFFLTENGQKIFAEIAKHIDGNLKLLELTFLLAFFVNIVADRWKQIFQNIGFVDSPAFFVANYIRGDSIEIKTIRKNIIRYLCLTQVLVLRDISIQVRKRFPNMECLIDSGLLQPAELVLMEKVQNGFPKYWMPINWIFAIAIEMRQKGHIAADVLLNALLQEVKFYREKLQNLCNYDWVPVPLAYPQVVFLAVRIYFLLCLVARQYLWHEKDNYHNLIDRVFPLVTVLQLIFIMGWVKVAEALLNPLGEDDDDFECNYIIDRNLAIALTMVDECHDQKPPQDPEDYEVRTPLYSEKSSSHEQHPLVGSATLSNLREENERVRMVERRPSEISADIKLPDSRRHSTNFFARRFSTISLNLRPRQSLSLQGKRTIQPANLNITIPDGWTHRPNGKANRKVSAESTNGLNPNTPGMVSIATAPELGQQFPSSPTSPSVELRSLQSHHLDPVKEVENDEDDGDMETGLKMEKTEQRNPNGNG